MPKSAVYGNIIDTYRPAEDDAIEPIKETVQLAAQVGWVKDGGTVQLAIIGRHPETASEVGLPGFAMDLDWTGINHLIRELRAARDSAYGRPE